MRTRFSLVRDGYTGPGGKQETDRPLLSGAIDGIEQGAEPSVQGDGVMGPGMGVQAFGDGARDGRALLAEAVQHFGDGPGLVSPEVDPALGPEICQGSEAEKRVQKSLLVLPQPGRAGAWRSRAAPAQECRGSTSRSRKTCRPPGDRWGRVNRVKDTMEAAAHSRKPAASRWADRWRRMPKGRTASSAVHSQPKWP